MRSATAAAGAGASGGASGSAAADAGAGRSRETFTAAAYGAGVAPRAESSGIAAAAVTAGRSSAGASGSAPARTWGSWCCSGCGSICAPGTELQMGVEVETSAIKVNPQNHWGFMIGDKMEWTLDYDTSDGTFTDRDGLSQFNRNIECKTNNGRNFADMDPIIQQIETVLKGLSRSRVEPQVIDIPLLQSFLGGDVSVYRADPRHFHVFRVMASDKPGVRIQITYQSPLSQVERIFMRLRELRHDGIASFLRDLNQTTSVPPEYELHAADDDDEVNILRRNAARSNNTSRNFLQNIARPFAETKGNVRGFCYIFLYYWHELFNNKEITKNFELLRTYEPGPKHYLGIMSRIPLSQLYDSLTSAEQKELRAIMDEVIARVGGQYRLRAYVKDGLPITPRLTLELWYGSIVRQERRIPVNRRQVDLLSPPPGMETTFSMGALDIARNSQGLSLLEARGYSTVRYNGHLTTLDDIRSFINREARWFFSVG